MLRSFLKKPKQRPRFAWLMLVVIAWTAGSTAWSTATVAAQEVRMRLSDRETWVGVPLTLSIEFVDEEPEESPQIPSVDGLKIEQAGAPARSSRISIINGRRTASQSTTYTWRVTPTREGAFVIPSFDIRTRSGVRSTEPVKIVATRSETDDLVFAEVDGARDQVYVGQSLPVTLKIWIRPYADRDLKIKLSPRDMFNLISDDSDWGIFADTIQKAREGESSIRSSKVLRKDSGGNEREYYLFEIDSTLYPTRPGKLDLEDVQIVVQYPTKLGRARDPFDSFFDDSFFGGRSPFDDLFEDFGRMGARIAITDWRPIVVSPKVGSTEVLPIPIANRPPDYRGAVGQYRIATTATPTDVKVGDPITLRIGIQGTGPMELVQAPPLDQIPSLTDGFKVPSGPLAGIVEGDIKVFETSIRPRRDDITEIPPIPFSFFDPDRGEFKTVYSDPIPLDVSPAEKLNIDSIVSQNPAAIDGGSRSGGSVGPDLAIDTSPDVLKSVDPSSIHVGWWLWLVVPPALVGLYYRVRGSGGSRDGLAHVTSRATISRIRSASNADQISQALLAFIASRLRLGRPTLTRSEAQIKLTGLLDPKNLERLDQCLGECERAAFAGYNEVDLERLKQEARELTAVVARMRHPQTAARTSWRPTRAVVWHSALAIALLGGLTWTWAIGKAGNLAKPADTTISNESVVQLDDQQIKILFDEANELYQLALEKKATAPAEAMGLFEKAAEKYELLIAQGIRNSRLFFNAGNAWFNAGRNGRAIVNYERGLKLNPIDSRTWRNLAWARDALDRKADALDAGSVVTATIEWIQRIPTQTWVTMLLAAWALLWISVWLHLVGRHTLEGWAAAASLVVAVAVVSTATWMHYSHPPTARAIVVSRQLQLFPSVGPDQKPIEEIRLPEGESVQVLQRRGEWLQIQTPSGTRGWTKEGFVETV